MFARIFFEKEKKKLSDQKSGSFLCIWILIIYTPSIKGEEYKEKLFPEFRKIPSND